MMLQPLYFSRLKLDPTSLDQKPSLDKLCIIHEAHLAHIPFENLSQHGAVGGPAVLNTEKTAEKILVRQRGGFCYEVNALLAVLLVELGYAVTRIPAVVHTGEQGYRPVATHMALIVRCLPATAHESVHYVDVGFAEPALHPLVYSKQYFGRAQTTPEGMQSRLVYDDADGDDNDDTVVLEWFMSGKWSPRLKWSWKESMLSEGQGPSLQAFADGLDAVHDESSIFSQKMIACFVTRTTKTTLAGSRLKVTGPPRFHNDRDRGQQGPVSIQHVEDGVSEARQLLNDRFGILLQETEGLDLDKSLVAAPEVWSHQ